MATDHTGSATTSPLPTLRAHRPLRWVLVALTFATGIVDAVSYLGLGHIFTANMTGNVVLLAFALAGTGGISIAGSLVSLAAFLVGAVAGGRLARGLEGWGHRWVATSLVIETVLLAIAALVAAILFKPNAAAVEYVIIALLALAMGIRNATVRRLAIPDLTTTVLTLTLTGLAADTQLPGGESMETATRRISAVVAMLLGAGLGAILVLRSGPPLPLAIVALLVLAVTAGYVYIAIARK